MSATTGSLPAPLPASDAARPSRRLHPVPVRIMHWTNAAAMLVMIGSGWGIYNDAVIFGGLHFAKTIKLGSWAAQSLLWHFAGMWLLVLNGAAYLIYGVVTGRLRERLLPIRLADLVQTVALSLLVPQTLWAMLTGGPRLASRLPVPGVRS